MSGEIEPVKSKSGSVEISSHMMGIKQESTNPDCCDKLFACGCCVALEKVGDAVVRALETVFYNLGVGIGKRPWVFIVAVILFTFCFLPGIFINFKEETSPINLWTPLGITARDHKDWVDRYYSSTVRFQSMIIEADNVLTPAVLQTMLDIDQAVKSISKSGVYDWETLCARLGSTCWSSSILELWSFDDATIRSLSQADILTKINNVTVSPVYFYAFNVENYLGQITKDGSGQIVSARATTMNYYLNITDTFEVEEEGPIEQWETEFLTVAQQARSGVTVYYFSGRSFGDEAGGAILDDISLLSAGYFIVIIFVAVTLGQYDCLQQKVYLSLGGVLCIGLSIAFTLGLCAYVSVSWGPLHNVLPFLVLGIGVDDIFVIVQCWDNLNPSTKSLPIHERIGLTMKHAGMSITVTSITDILAFGVGASTILPALRSFCIYCSICILANFLFQVLLFTACLALDQRRAESSRNACCCCYVHTDYKPGRCHNKSLVSTFFERVYSRFITNTIAKVFIVLTALGVFAGGVYGAVKIEQYFDEKWFIPSGSYLLTYFEKSETYFPDDGVMVGVYMGEIDYFNKYSEMEQVYFAAGNNSDTQAGSVSAWFYSYRQWLSESASDPTVSPYIDATSKYPTSPANYYNLLNQFLNTSSGSRFSSDIVFQTTTKIIASRMSLVQGLIFGSNGQIAAMDRIRMVCDGVNLEGECFAYSDMFLDFEGNRVIQEELYRNLGLAFLCVVVLTLILLANVWCCFLVSVCVCMSLVDVMGFIYFWGLTIDTVSTVNLVIAIGLTVDYSAHIAHTFMTEVGTRNDRVMSTMSLIGPAVFNGGFSTFLAFVLLGLSGSYVFRTFFKIFLLVVVWGLFHGMAVLPVLLSWVGPPPYLSARNADHSSKRQLMHQQSKVHGEKDQVKDTVLHGEKNQVKDTVLYSNGDSKDIKSVYVNGTLHPA